MFNFPDFDIYSSSSLVPIAPVPASDGNKRRACRKRHRRPTTNGPKTSVRSVISTGASDSERSGETGFFHAELSPSVRNAVKLLPLQGHPALHCCAEDFRPCRPLSSGELCSCLCCRLLVWPRKPEAHPVRPPPATLRTVVRFMFATIRSQLAKKSRRTASLVVRMAHP